MKYIKDTNLNFLENVKSEDLNNLVEILTKTKTQELKGRDIYKEFNPNHNLYWEEIASELQYFGGNSIANIFRKKGILYKEILKDVAKTLGVDIRNQLSVEDKENILLNLDKKEGIINNIKKQFKSLDIKDGLLIASRFTPLALTTLPILIAKKLSDPAYRITTEAVFEIANLRKKYKSISKEIIIHPAKKNPVLKYTESLVIKDEKNDSNIAEIKVIENNSIKKLNLEESNNKEIGGISHFISDITKGLISTSNQTVELIFSPEVQKGLANGSYKLLEDRAIVISTNGGKIKEHARIIQSGKGKQFLTGGYQLLSIAVAQSHLADIEKRLYGIESSLKQILNKLEAEDKSRIQGAIDYLNSMYDYMKRNDYKNELSSSQKVQIETINKDILHWQNKLLEEFKSLINEVDRISDKDTFGTENTFNELRRVYKERITPLNEKYKLLIELYLLLIALVKFVDPLDKEFTRINFKFEEFQDKFNDINKLIKEKKESKLTSYFNLDDTLIERKKVLKILEDKQKDNFDSLSKNYKIKLEKIENSFNNVNNGEISIIVSLNEDSKIKNYLIKN